MKYFKIAHMLLIFIFCLLLQFKAVCQDSYQRDTLDVNENDEEYYQESDSVDNVYPDYYRVSISPGHSRIDNLKLSSYSKQFYINVNYCYSKFSQPLEYIPTQLGLYSEIGLNNTSAYFNIGPELRMERYFYLIPYAGISLIPFPKYGEDGAAVIYYAGAAAGCIVKLNADTDIIIEAASDFIFKRDKDNTYLKIGISYNLFYPL